MRQITVMKARANVIALVSRDKRTIRKTRSLNICLAYACAIAPSLRRSPAPVIEPAKFSITV